MALQIPVQKDIGEFEEKVVGKMTLRTLVCACCGFGAAVSVAAFSMFALGVPASDATLPVMAASVPFWLVGFWKPFGMRAEEFAPLAAEFHLADQKLLYRPTTAIAYPPAPAPRPARAQLRRARRAFRKRGGELYEPTQAPAQGR